MADSRIFRFYKTASMLVLVILISGILLVVREIFSPANWVEVTIRNVPAGLRELYLIADGRSGVRFLKFYRAKILVFAEDPVMYGWPGQAGGLVGPLSAAYQWPNARRYGALARRGDGSWMLWWFEPADLDGPSISRYLVGGGRSEIRLPDESRSIAPTPGLLGQVGLPERPENQ